MDSLRKIAAILFESLSLNDIIEARIEYTRRQTDAEWRQRAYMVGGEKLWRQLIYSDIMIEPLPSGEWPPERKDSCP